ncbi:unnamed protein product [Schistocephalus solidus]|uniref:Uncharacterized protein n=1 Tax=Schistocephalus solidus TaxID=70667 RepID=A0A183T621_SCHSO|nr:unnamed protein product [Schistocephalus solidus]
MRILIGFEHSQDSGYSQQERKTDGVSQRLRRPSREPTASTKSGARGNGLPRYPQTTPKAACSDAERMVHV